MAKFVNFLDEQFDAFSVESVSEVKQGPYRDRPVFQTAVRLKSGTSIGITHFSKGELLEARKQFMHEVEDATKAFKFVDIMDNLVNADSVEEIGYIHATTSEHSGAFIACSFDVRLKSGFKHTFGYRRDHICKTPVNNEEAIEACSNVAKIDRDEILKQLGWL